HPIAALDARQHLALLLHLALLRPDQQEVEDDEDEDQREKLDEEIRAAAGALRPRFRDEHRPCSDLSFRPPKSARTIAALGGFATQGRGDMVAPFSARLLAPTWALDDDGSRAESHAFTYRR